MKTTLSPLPLVSLLTLAACEMPTEPSDELRSLPGVCPTNEQIVELVAPGACPTVTGWTGNAISPRYGSYRWTGQGTPNVEALAAKPGIAEVGSNCGVVTEHAQDHLATQFGPNLHDRFIAQIDAINAQELAAIQDMIDPQAVTVAVVDTSPVELPLDHTSSPHGEAMVHIISSVACPGDCLIDVQRVLALPLVDQGERDLVHGGYVGSFGDLAQGIRNAADLPSNRVVINLAVGWEGEEFGDLGDTPAVDAVYEALEYASCKGALILAAAGNEGGVNTIGPVLPGGWERHAAPTQNRCQQLGVVGGRKPGYHPLVFSIAGVDGNDDAIQNARPGALPRLVAAASHVNVETSSPTMTGTSVSTAAVAGAAALVWSHFPGLDAPQVMGYLYSSGRPIGIDSDYQLSQQPLPVRQLDVCMALQQACAATTSCPATLTCDGPSHLDDLQDELEAINDSIVGVPLAPVLQAGCNDPAMQLYSATGVLTCAQPQDPNLTYTEPQPTQPACPNCTIKKQSGTLTATLDPEFATEVINAVDVEVMAAGRSYYYRLGGVTLTSSTPTNITLIPAPPAYDSATISITFAPSPVSSGRPMTNPLLIVQ